MRSYKDVAGKDNGDVGVHEVKDIISGIMRRYRTIITMIQIWLIKFSHKTGTYVLLRCIYHKVVDKKY